jgi:hypothetical protein
MKLGLIAAGLAGGLLVTASANASISYSVAGSTYTQNFDSLPNDPTNASLGTSPAGWIDDTSTPGAGQFSILGWYLWHPVAQATEGGANNHQRLRAGRGNSGTGAFYSFGDLSSTERALGMVPATTMAGNNDSMRIGLRLTNSTGLALTSFTVTYDGEQYRDGEAVNSISLSYVLNDALASGDTWHDAGAAAHFVSAGAFNAPATVNDNSFGLPLGATTGITATVDLSATPWQPGTDLWLRWSEIQMTGTPTNPSDDGLAVDNLNFTAAVPEPGSLALLGLGGMFLVRRRSR